MLVLYVTQLTTGILFHWEKQLKKNTFFARYERNSDGGNYLFFSYSLQLSSFQIATSLQTRFDNNLTRK